LLFFFGNNLIAVIALYMLTNSMFSKLTFIGGAFLLTTLIFAPITGYADTAQPWFIVPGTNPFNNIYYNGWVSVNQNTQPKSALDVKDTISVTNPVDSSQYLYLNTSGSTTLNSVNIGGYKNAGTTGYSSFIINGGSQTGATGYVGVRQPTPAYPLDVFGTINTNSNIQASGNVISNGVINANDNGKPAGGAVINTGDDAQITDIDQANSLGIQGTSNTTQVRIKLGSNGGWLTSNNGEVCLGAC
jgi:hypothetical protein